MEVWLKTEPQKAPPLADEPGEGTLYDTGKFWNEEERIKVLESLGLLDTPQEEFFDSVTRTLMKLFDTQCSHLVLIDPTRCWFKSWQGGWVQFETETSHGPNVECPREEGWCNYILVPDKAELLIIEDAQKDGRLALNPFVVGPPHFRFYAGAPLVGSRGERYGTLCVADFVPRSFKAEAYAMLTNFAHLVVEELERNKTLHGEMAASAMNYVERSRSLDLSLHASKEGILMLDLRESSWPVLFSNPAVQQALGMEAKDLVGCKFWDVFECRKHTKLELGISTGLGDMFQLEVSCIPTGQRVGFQMLPVTSDRLAPSKATSVPAWVPFEDSPPLSSSVHARMKIDRETELVRSCKSFWFAVVSDLPMLTEENLTAVAEQKDSGGYAAPLERRVSTSSTKSDVRTKISSVLSSSGWSSVFSDYALPAKFSGALELGPLLGHGSFGKAYRATTSAGVAVALKVVDCRRRDDNVIQQQLREIQLSASLEHPNVVKTIEYASSSDTSKSGKQIDILWIVQELCDLGHLSSFIERGFLRHEKKITSPASMPVVLATLLDVASAVSYIHQRSIIHADLTGRNVLISSEAETQENPRGFVAKVADFGFARCYLDGGKPLPTQDIGTITHMPPELMDPAGGVLVPAADIWSLAVVGWEAFHGKCCYQGKNPAQVVISVFRGNTPPWDASAPTDFADLMKSCMKYAHKERPTALQVAEGLRSLLAAASVDSVPLATDGGTETSG
mmetsp:Transcript_8848/g.21117  ORF Transcript_8848/g.21117 Transcript_8848/m.21117 type:complete len:735 (-) Transcript_8848:170-2374(-)